MDIPVNQTVSALDDDTPLVVVFRPADAIQAEIVRGALEGEGIYAVIGEQVTGAYEGAFSVGEGAWGDILVAQSDAARAESILADFDAQSTGIHATDLDELTQQAMNSSDPQV